LIHVNQLIGGCGARGSMFFGGEIQESPRTCLVERVPIRGLTVSVRFGIQFDQFNSIVMDDCLIVHVRIFKSSGFMFSFRIV
jgi:hypothetical protein